MTLKLPRLGALSVTDKSDKSTREFSRFWDEFATAIETAFANIDTLNSTIGDVSATGLFRAIQGTTSGGAEATIELQVRAGLLEAFRAASIKLSALAAGLSRIEIDSDEVLINGTVMSNGGVLSGHLEDNAATDSDSIAFTVSTMSDTTWRDCALVSRTWSGKKVQFDFTTSIDNNDSADHKIRFRLQKDGVTLKEFPVIAGRGYVIPAQDELSVTITRDDTPTAASHDYAFQYTNVVGDLTPLDLDGTFRWSDIKK